MLGLFGTLNLGARSLQTQQTGVEVAGQNLANINNTAYARQRVDIQTSPAISSYYGPEGTGANVVAITQLRNSIVDGQIQNENSVGSYWQSQQSALQYAQADLGEYINLQTGSTSSTSNDTTSGLAGDLSDLFNAFQSVATSPSSLTERQLLLNKAQTLADRLNQTSAKLTSLGQDLNTSMNNDVSSANSLLSDIAKLNDQIVNSEIPQGGVANDLRDLRQQKLEQLSQLVNIQTSTAANGTVSVSIGGTTMVSDRKVQDTLQTYDAGGGQMLVRAATSGTPLTLSGGSIQGTIDVRDGALKTLSSSLDTLAGQLITQVNTLHQTGYSLSGTTGADFFTGTDAATIQVNSALTGDPSLIQAAGTAGASGDNSVALALAQLADQPISGLGNQTFSSAYSTIVSQLGNNLSTANQQLADHDAVSSMLSKQRDSVSGVSVDEEMTNLMQFQKAYAASAKLVTTVAEMLDTILSMKT